MLKGRLRIVLDTNVLLVSISSKSKYHWIYQKLLRGDFDLFISNDILLEYEEIIDTKYNTNVTKDVVRSLLVLPNVYQLSPYYNWNLIDVDPDDNKFEDCAVSANAHYIISNDNHFSILETVEFPKVKVPKELEFKLLFEI